MAKGLGRRPPTDWAHYEKYPLSAVPRSAVLGKGAVLGINWYSNFDNPVQDGRVWWIGRGRLGSIRGGHAIAVRNPGSIDLTSWWDFYDQGNTSRCVGYSCSRLMSHLNRKRYAAPWLYSEAQLHDEWPGEDYEGTSVRAGFGVLLNEGHRPISNGIVRMLDLAEGISAYRWVSDWNDLRHAIGVPDSHPGVSLMNSWGRGYPHYVRITDEAGARVLAEDGEIGVVTDR